MQTTMYSDPSLNLLSDSDKSNFSLNDSHIMTDLMRKIGPVLDRTSARSGLTTGMANTICNNIGSPNYKVVPNLNKKYFNMHEISEKSFNRTGIVHGGGGHLSKAAGCDDSHEGSMIFDQSFYDKNPMQSEKYKTLNKVNDGYMNQGYRHGGVGQSPRDNTFMLNTEPNS
mmetsp:Transcript_37350/g.49099  ORF Transcript_37350/g.49099 Transcript_37350/m.49099 type:complete len:170 (+) Transcript_37350:38-547(+)